MVVPVNEISGVIYNRFMVVQSKFHARTLEVVTPSPLPCNVVIALLYMTISYLNISSHPVVMIS